MDDRRFEAVSRALAAGVSRRKALKVLLGGGGAGLLSLAGRGKSAAAPNCGLPGGACCTTRPNGSPGLYCLGNLDCFRGRCGVRVQLNLGSGEAINLPPQVAEAVNCGQPNSLCCATGQKCRPDLDCVRGVCIGGLRDFENLPVPIDITD